MLLCDIMLHHDVSLVVQFDEQLRDAKLNQKNREWRVRDRVRKGADSCA